MQSSCVRLPTWGLARANLTHADVRAQCSHEMRRHSSVWISAGRRFRAALPRGPSREQVEPALCDLKPAPTVFFGGGSVCPFLRVFGVTEVLFFAIHFLTPTFRLRGRTRRHDCRSSRLEFFQENLAARKKSPAWTAGPLGSGGHRGDGSLPVASKRGRWENGSKAFCILFASLPASRRSLIRTAARQASAAEFLTVTGFTPTEHPRKSRVQSAQPSPKNQRGLSWPEQPEERRPGSARRWVA
jgi:hypothetical protein